jgi:hypothetical protein
MITWSGFRSQTSQRDENKRQSISQWTVALLPSSADSA